MRRLHNYLPEKLATSILVTLFSLLVGLSQRRISLKREGETTPFGTDRTFTLIGMLGYLLYILGPREIRFLMGDGLILGMLLGLNYYVRQTQFHVFGMTTTIVALITYCIALIVSTRSSWFYVMVIVTVLLFTELRHTFTETVQRTRDGEVTTPAKFSVISGIILPMLSSENIIPGTNLTPYTIWLATTVVSGISYLSYLLKRYVFCESGVLVSGTIGGLYSSTATIPVLARKSRNIRSQEASEHVAAMLSAVSMMFLCFVILILTFSSTIFASIYPYLLTMAAVAAGVVWPIHCRRKQTPGADLMEEKDDSSNLLEFKVALILTGLFIAFTVLTRYTLIYAGIEGLNSLSFASGSNDITPFTLNLLQGTGSVVAIVMMAYAIQAIIDNIVVSVCYALFFSDKQSKLYSWILNGFGYVIAANVAVLFFFYLI